MSIENLILDRLFWFLMGCMFGLMLGWSHNALRYARQSKNEIHATLLRIEELVKGVHSNE